MGHRAVIVPGSGTWVWCVWAEPDLWGCTGATLGVADVCIGAGVMVRDRGCLWFWSGRYCRCNGWRLQQLCRLSGCRKWCRNARSGRSQQCGCCDIWGSVSGLGTVFTEVSSHAVVDHPITGVHLVAVFWQDVPQWQGSRSYGRVSYIAMGWPA